MVNGFVLNVAQERKTALNSQVERKNASAENASISASESIEQHILK